MRRLIVIGGGISGLAAARAAADRAAEVPGGLDVVVLERDADVGGKVRTAREDGWLVEEGPTGFLDNEPALDRLIAAAGLERRPADEAAAHRYLVRGGTMREIAAHPVRFVRSGILGPLGLLRIALEPVIPGRDHDTGDESVWQFACRRLGRQAADRLIAPMVLGVFAGDAKRLSLPASFPKMAQMESEHGSLVRALIARRRAAKSSGQTVGGPAGPAGWLTSFDGGLAALPRALARTPGLRVETGVTAQAVRPRAGGGFVVEREPGPALEADAVVLAGEPWAMAPLVQDADRELARLLGGIDCPPVTVVALGWRREQAPGVPRGFGVLIPRGEGYRILGCLWDSFIFPGRAPEGHVLVRAMLGGAVDREVGSWDERRTIEQTRADLARLLGVTAEPVFARVARWPRAIPQYEIGHRERVAAIERRAAAMPGLFVAGNALDGIAFGKAAARGVAMGEAAARFVIEGRVV
ncbi:MAG: protoporphyrinogen oxidase [Acidobacteriota bacterium]